MRNIPRVQCVVFLASYLIQVATAQMTTILPPTTTATTTSCQANCTTGITHPIHYQWFEVQVASSIVAATVVVITDDDGSVDSSTIFNELPEGLVPPPTNAAGTQTAQVILETRPGEYLTSDL
jgi:hypothetical protein